MADAFAVDAAAGSEARYNTNLQRVRFLFLDSNDNITCDPIEFAQQAFSAATPTSMTPPSHVSWSSPIAWGRLYRSSPIGDLFAYVRVMTRPIEPLMKLDGWSGWEFRDGGLCEPSEEQIAQVPAMCTSTLLLFRVPVDQLYVPVDAPDRLTVVDAKASVGRVVKVLNEQVRPVLNQMEGGL